MIETILTAFPYRNYNTAINTLINDTLKLAGEGEYYPTRSQYKNYKLYEEDNNIVFKCLATGLSEQDLDIKFKDRTLQITTQKEDSADSDFNVSINRKFSLHKDIDVNNSYANLDKGILTVTMPLKENGEDLKINFK